jgi:hypothetical protein
MNCYERGVRKGHKMIYKWCPKIEDEGSHHRLAFKGLDLGYKLENPSMISCAGDFECVGV